MDFFKEITPYEVENAMKLIGKDWMLITVRDDEKGKVNAMTASWGSLGVIWNKCVLTCMVRPQRYTYSLAEKEDRFSVAFLGEENRSALKLCGTLSGRDTDKLEKAGLHSCMLDGVPVISEARLALVCRKLYSDDLKKDRFLDSSLLSQYTAGDFHRFYVCEIEKAFIKA